MTKYFWFIVIGIILLVFLTRKKLTSLLKNILDKWETYVSHPYWDYKQWSWGFGSEVPDSIPNPTIKPKQTFISRNDAYNKAFSIMSYNRSILSNALKRSLNENQWAALLSFAYNAGIGAALKLVPEINSGAATLESHWKSYRLAGGKVNDNLVSRRSYEWNLYNS